MNRSSSPDWLTTGRGRPPRPAWSFTTDAPLVALQLARETGEVLAADESGGLYLLSQQGQIETVSRGFRELRALAWCDTAEFGAVQTGTAAVSFFDRTLRQKWSLELPAPVLSLAIAPFGHYLAIGLEDTSTCIYDSRKKRVAIFRTPRPLRFLSFCVHEPSLIGAADHGVLCSYQINGAQNWQENLLSNVGGMCVAGDGSVILLATFTHGIQKFTEHGVRQGAYLLEGTAQQVAMSFVPERILSSTVERHLYWLNSNGDLRWGASPPEDVTAIVCGPLGDWAVCGFASGQLLQLDWHG